MALNINIVQTQRSAVTYSDETARDLQETADTLAGLPNTRYAEVAFEDAKTARRFAKEAKAWADDNGYKFYRKGPVSEAPETVTFRVYAPKSGE